LLSPTTLKKELSETMVPLPTALIGLPRQVERRLADFLVGFSILPLATAKDLDP